MSALFCTALVLLLVFGIHQNRVREPLVNLPELRRWPILATNAASVLFGFALFASFVATTGYVQAPAASGYGFDASVTVAGLALLPSGLAMLALSPVSASLIGRIGASRVLALGATVIALGWIVRLGLTENLAEVVLGTTIVGAGTGIAYAAIPALIAAHTAPSELGSANGINSLSRAVGSSLATAIGTSILAAATVTLGGTALPSLAAYRVLFTICIVASLGAALLALMIPPRAGERRPQLPLLRLLAHPAR